MKDQTSSPDSILAPFFKNFLWGAASSSFQVEGSPAPSDWSQWTKTPGKIKDHSNADLATDFWNRYEEDFALLESIGGNSYRLSIAWERVEPHRGAFDESAIAHYKKIILSMKRHGLEPIVTLHHFVLPIWLAADGGLLAKSFIEDFTRFGAKMVEALADEVQLWMTFNEPNVQVRQGYLEGDWPPGIKNQMNEAIRALSQMAEAHISLVEKMRPRFTNLRWGIAHHARPFETKRNRLVDRLIAKTLDWIFNRQFLSALTGNGIFWAPGAKPIFNFHPRAKTLDYIGINYYGRVFIEFEAKPPFMKLEAGDGEKTDLGWEIYPSGLKHILTDLYSRFKLPFIISENGLADSKESQRIKFLEDHLKEMKDAQSLGIPIFGYLHWSLTDNFEWSEGLHPRFGLIEIDYTKDAEKIPRGSFYHFKKIIGRKTSTNDEVQKDSKAVHRSA